MNRWLVAGILVIAVVALLALKLATKQYTVNVQPSEINTLGEYQEVTVPENIATEVNVLPSSDELNVIAEDVDIQIPPEI